MSEEYFIAIHCLKIIKILSYHLAKPIPLTFVPELVTVTSKS
jgi:hypothetical protein